MIGKHMSVLSTQNDDGSLFRVTGCARFGGHHNAYRICGTKGQIENLRGMNDQIMLRYNPWNVPEGKEHITGYMYEPWHVRYVGVELATAVAESGLCLEEYFGITSSYS